MRTYTVGQIAKIVGLPAKTIRFYEEEGVISTPERQANGYRVYSDSNIEDLKLLKYARDLGLPLTEVKKLLKGCEGGDCEHSQDYITHLIDSYTEQLSVRMKEMKTLREKLLHLKHHVLYECKPGEPYCCNILNQLTEGGEEK